MIYSNSLSSEISMLERKIELLLNQHKELRAEIQQAKQENAELRSVLAAKEEEINDFQKTIKISKLAHYTVADQDETTELKRTINEYIKKIDKCIAHLSQ
uniref:Uncharacterized protein n=1 Tax=Roseihalotalea indica TaxID=2867963 RepID=A0AA49GRP4_9BACT|nr:hypothetical protein K4G66_11815 [Tunicatimonas sp. TK19036]